MIVITLASMKGGVGKTTNSILIANNLAARGFKVLYFELDIQNNSATTYYTKGIENINTEILKKNNFQAFTDGTILPYVVPTTVKNIDIIPNSPKMKKLNPYGANDLKKAFQTVESNYDYIVVDTSPYYNMITLNALSAADIILTPVQFTDWDVTTLESLQESIFDDCPQKANDWYIFYSDWQSAHEKFETSVQSQFADYFEEHYKNIIDVKIPRVSAAVKYTQTGELLSTTSAKDGNRKLAEAVNRMVDMITGVENPAERF